MGFFKTASIATVALAIIVAFAVFPMLPASVPTHWGAGGAADGWGSPVQGAFLFPAIMIFTLALFWVIPKIAVFKKNMAAFENKFWGLGFALQIFFLIFFVISLLPNFGYNFNMSQLFAIPLAFLFISIGIFMPSFKRNFFVGIRTPWTLANDAVWKKTHVLGGKLFILTGFMTLFSLPFPESTVFVSVGFAVLSAIGLFAYSYFEFRKSGRNTL